MQNVPSFAADLDQSLQVEGLGLREGAARATPRPRHPWRATTAATSAATSAASAAAAAAAAAASASTSASASAAGATPDDDGKEVNPLTVAWRKYESLLDDKPLLMKALTSFVGFAIGDILAQVFIQKGEFDFARLFRLASFGFFVHGTTSHWFYGMLDGKIPGTSAKVVFTKVFIDQVLWNPIFGTVFFTYLNFWEGKTVDDLWKKLNADLQTAVMGSWGCVGAGVSPAVQLRGPAADANARERPKF